MKIGIITFHKAYNIGAALQSYALLHYLQTEGYDAELIDYLPNNAVPKRQNTVRRFLHFVHKVISYRQIKESEIKEEAFQNFWKNYYCLSSNSYYGDKDIERLGLKYDVLISSSDQILNTTLTGNSIAYYLGFDSEATKISYASSFGREYITELEHQLIKNELIKFKSISVREKSAAKIIINDIGYNPELVVDPVFLLPKAAWEKISSLKKCIRERYILVYAMECSAQISNAIDFVVSNYCFPIITVYGYRNDVDLIGQKVTCGPDEFLGLVSNADYVITNSYHGTALSFIFGKKVLVCSHTTKNTRIQNVMELVDEESKLIDRDTSITDSSFVDGTIAYNKLKTIIQLSKDYIKKNTNIVV